MTQTFGSNAVAKVTRLSLRQLQWWDERNVVTARHEGHRRIYFVEDLREIAVLAEFRRKGLSLQGLRRMQPTIRRHLRSYNALSGIDLYLLTDGRRLFSAHSQQMALDLLTQHSGPLSVVAVHDALAKVATA